MPAPDAAATYTAIRGLPAAARDPWVADVRLVRLPGNLPPWTDTGIAVAAGEWISLLASGRLVLSADLDLSFAPSLALWGRIGGHGPLLNGTRDTASFQASHAGPLALAVYNGEWATEDGDLATPVEAYATAGGTIAVVVVRWRGSARDGLEGLLRDLPHDPLLAAELARLHAALEPPRGWTPLWFLGPTECFRDAVEDGRPAIHVDAQDSVGIVQKPVAFPLGPDTMLTWRWRVDELPAVGPEDSPIAHDYLSLALAFENGRDLTWYWSAALPIGAHYHCPLPTWTARETHWVVRSGADGLGTWHAERRRVADDYRAAVGPAPARIVAAWFIAVTIFGRRRGRAAFADVVLRDGDRELRVV